MNDCRFNSVAFLILREIDYLEDAVKKSQIITYGARLHRDNLQLVQFAPTATRQTIPFPNPSFATDAGMAE